MKLTKLKYGIESVYAIHGWDDPSAPDDVVWHWQLTLPSVRNFHMAAYGARTVLEQIVFPTIEEDLVWTYETGHERSYDKRIMNKWIVNELAKKGYVEGRHWNVTNRPSIYDSIILFSTLPVRTEFMRILGEIMKQND